MKFQKIIFYQQKGKLMKVPNSDHTNIKYYIHTYYPGWFYIVDPDEGSYLQINFRIPYHSKKYNWVVFYEKSDWVKNNLQEVSKNIFYSFVDEELKAYAKYFNYTTETEKKTRPD